MVDQLSDEDAGWGEYDEEMPDDDSLIQQLNKNISAEKQSVFQTKENYISKDYKVCNSQDLRKVLNQKISQLED